MTRAERAVYAFVIAVVLLAVDVSASSAVILPPVTIDGPSEQIAGLGGVAMAEDGTGGLVYLKRVEGVSHVFVSRFEAGGWRAPIRVDTGEPFAASWPRIGAADNGQLVVVWATPFASHNGHPLQELLSSTLGPGASSFGPAMIIDGDIGNGVGTSPDLAMTSTGQADVVYRVLTDEAGQTSTVPLLRPGDVVGDVRVARYDGGRWSGLGAVNRDPGVSMRPPTQVNAPRIAVGPTGNGVVVWQEPDIEGVARIWARRLFGTSLDYVLPVSANTYNGASIGDDADAPSVTISRLGQAEVAYRQGSGPGSPLPGPRIFLNTLPDGESADGGQFAGAVVADSSVPGGRSAVVGPPNVDVDEKQNLRLLFDVDGAPHVVQGTDKGLAAALPLGPGFVGSGSAASVMNPAGGGLSAWPSADAQGHGALAVRQDYPSGAVQTALVSGGAGGEISELDVGRSGLGDGLVAFQQGPLGNAAIVADEASAPPEQFVVDVPKTWVRPSRAVVSWLPATSASGPLSYRVILDGHPIAAPSGALTMRLNPRGLGDGSHRVQVLASDIDGQATLSAANSVRVDGNAPTVKVRRVRGGTSVLVRVRDVGSGVAKPSVHISFGDGGASARRSSVRHHYARAGIYEIVVQAKDKLGNAGVVRRLVSVQ